MDRSSNERSGLIDNLRARVLSLTRASIPRNVTLSSIPAANLAQRYILRIHTLLILFWIWLVYWGERTSFNQSIEKCHWKYWEQWVRRVPLSRLVRPS